MATTNVEIGESEETILYDLTEHAEWKQENELFRHAAGKQYQQSAFGKITSSTQRRGWTVLRSIGLPMQTASPCSLPQSLVRLINCTINWQIAVSRDGSLVAIMQDQCIEIRSKRDDYAVITGRAAIERDSHPQWRHLVWSPDNTMLACSYSNGTVEVYDIVGTQLFSIPGREVAQGVTDLSEAVVGLMFTDKVPDPDWSSELLVINYHGKLSSYKVDRDSGHQLRHMFLFNSCYPLGISCVVYHGQAGLLYVGGCGQAEEGVSEAMKEGLTVWRILSDSPHYKLVTDYAEDLTMAQSQKSLRKRLKLPSWSRLRGEMEEGLYRLSLSLTGQYLMSVHFSGKVCLWTVPSLKLTKSWNHAEQPYSDEISPKFTENPQLRKQVKDLVNTKLLLDLDWWSNEAVILARGTGSVTVSSIKTLNNLLGNQPEWFEPAPRISGVHDGGFLGLEVECRFPSKRVLPASDDDESDDEDEAGVMSRSWGVAKQCLHYVTDMDTFKPPKKKPRLVNRTYRLICLRSTTPEQLFARKLENEEYGEAKALAQAYRLDVDLVYQRQWRKSTVEISSIQDYLSKISKRSWVLHECVERMSDKIDAMKELLEFGLRGTDLPALIMIGKGEDKGRFILCDPEDGLYEDVELDSFDPEIEQKREQLRQDRTDGLVAEVDFDNLTLEQRELCRARKKLLQFLYRLKTYEYILGGVSYAAERYDPKFFEKFRSENIVELAIDYAQSSDWKALEILFTFHGQELLPHRLAILNNFPETTSPSEFKILLPEISESEVLPWCTDRWNKEDWVDLGPCKTVLQRKAIDPGEFIYDESPDLAKYRGDVSGETLTDWYEYRAKEIERLSRQADCALEFVKLAMERNVQGLEHVLDDLITMEMLVYSCHVDETLNFQQLQDMADYDKLELIMSKSSDVMYSKNLRKWMVPFLKQCERRTRGSYIHLLRDYVVTSARSDLTRPLHIFEASKTYLPNPIIPKQADLMSLGRDAIYSCQRDDQLHLALEILTCLPQRGYGADTKEIQKLHIDVDQLEHHLNAAKVLEGNGIQKPIYYIKQSESDGDEAEQLMVRLTRNLGRREATVSDAQWSKLHGEMMELQDKVYRCVSPSLCHAIFVESLLCSSNIGYIQLAGHMVERSESSSHTPTPLTYNMHTRVTYTRAVELVLMAAQEYFNSSANLTDTCMDLARSCLNLIQDSPVMVQEEHDLISALSVLQDFGVTILPLQVRLCKERVSLIQQAVDTKQLAYTQKQKLLRLGHLLRITAVDRNERDAKVLHIIANAALKNKDFAFAYETCVQLMASCHGAAWDVCVDLAEYAEFHNVQAKVELLSFAVTYCMPDMIEPILQARALLETQVLFEGISSKMPDSTEESDIIKRVSPFSAKAALQQTQHILTSTKQTTKAMLSTVTDSKWWHSTVNRMRQPAQRRVSSDLTNRNKSIELQACHPFYDGFIENCYSNLDEADFQHLEMHIDPETLTSEKLLRTAQLEEMLTEGEKSQSCTEVLLQLASESFCTDSSLSLAYLLALQQPSEADRCFADHTKTDISLQLAVYYYALQLYSAVRPVNVPHMSPLYLLEPAKIMRKVTSLVCQKKEVDWPDYVVDLVVKIKHYNEMLADYRQAKVLTKLGRGIDTQRFASDSEYKRETILGLSMTLEDSIYNISMSLAERYDISRWQVYATHLEFLLCDSGLPVEELQTRVTKLNILDVLRSQPEELCERMTTYVYPSLDGTDHQVLLYYYSMMLGCQKPLQGGLTADNHVKLLKKLKSIAAGLDYRQLMDASCNVLGVLSPSLSSSNVTTFAKLAKQIPDQGGGTLDASIVYCTWAAKFFWEGDGKKHPDSTTAWIHRYEACSDYIQRINPHHIPHFIQAIVFTEKSTTMLEIDCRMEICKRILKFIRQHIHKKKKAGDESQLQWESVLATMQRYLIHLETLSHPAVMALSEATEGRVQVYLAIYDLSMGSVEQVHQLLISMLLEGEMSIESVGGFCTGVGDRGWTIVTVLKDCVDYLLACLSKRDCDFEPLIPVEYLVSLEKLVQNVQYHIGRGEELITSEVLLSQLRPFCSDTTVDVQPRLDVLHILEKSFHLSEADSVLLTLYRTQAVVSDVWPLCQILEKDITSTVSREKLFFDLLEKSNASKGDYNGKAEFSALCRLLKLWPSFSKLGDSEKLWVSLYKSMIASGCHDNTLLALETVKTTDTQLTYESVEMLFNEMVKQEFYIDAIKLPLITEHKKLFPVAMELLSGLTQINEEGELIDLILKHHLAPDLVPTSHYPIILHYLLTNQVPEIESCNHLSVEGLANELGARGYEAEAGSLILKAKTTPAMLQTFGTALGSITKWFK